jgi:hypothetical protein
MVYSGNRFLTYDEMKVNANYILHYLTGKGWSKQAVCGMLGNMQTESTINPGIWQNLDQFNLDGGVGLVQWTPSSKYLDWCSSHDLVYFEMESNLKRIEYEVENNIQWINSLDPKNRSFYEFTQSTDSPYDLAMVFIAAYERPKEPNQPNRGTQALHWYEVLTGDFIGPDPDGNVTYRPKHKKVVGLLLSDALNGWRGK